jgi:GNAT superfamily N-acetyltransferase
MSEILYREASAGDLPDIVSLIADDPLGQTRERPGPQPDHAYLSAFEAIERDPNQMLVVAVDEDRIIGTLQLSFIPGLARMGAWRGQIDAVRIAKDRRQQRLGEALISWAVEQCRKRGCKLVQLTTDRRRPDAHRFYDRLGFKPTHIGYKLNLG